MPRFIAGSGLYGWDAPELKLKSAKWRCVLWAAVSLVLSVVCGLVPTGVTRDNLVGFAGTASLAAAMLMIIAAVRFFRAEALLDYRTFHSIHGMMDYAPLFHAMLMITALIAGAVSCFRDFTGAPDLAVLALFTAAAAFSLMARKTYRGIPTYTLKEQET